MPISADQRIDAAYQVYVPTHQGTNPDPVLGTKFQESLAVAHLSFSSRRFAEYLARGGIPWPRLASGQLALDDDTFRQMARTYPVVAPLRELRHSLGEKLRIGLAGLAGSIEISELCRWEGTNPTQFYGWKRQLM